MRPRPLITTPMTSIIRPPQATEGARCIVGQLGRGFAYRDLGKLENYNETRPGRIQVASRSRPGRGGRGGYRGGRPLLGATWGHPGRIFFTFPARPGRADAV